MRSGKNEIKELLNAMLMSAISAHDVEDDEEEWEDDEDVRVLTIKWKGGNMSVKGLKGTGISTLEVVGALDVAKNTILTKLGAAVR